MGERRDEESGEPGTGFPLGSAEPLLQRAVAVLQSSYLHPTSQEGFQYSKAVLVENALFLSELRAFAQAKEAAGYSQEELEETFGFLLFDNEEEAQEVCQSGLRVNSSSLATLGDPAKGVYISKYADCLHPSPWYPGQSGYIVICKLIKGKVKVVSENFTPSHPSPGYDCHVAASSPLPAQSSYSQAFQQSQYYVYEVSGTSAAERPRQICPYIIISCQYLEPKAMPVLARESLPELNDKALYCPWRGQLSIQGQFLCNIALRTPHSSTIPAQLPPNLDIKHVMGLSDLKKKLPEAAFGKRNYTEHEVCFQGVYLSLYEVEISNKDQHKMDHLVESLKEKELAIIKYLQDQGVLILLTSSALARDDGFDPKEPLSLLALFLFTSSRSLCLRAEKPDAKDEREESDISLKIASVLPGLRYALQKATSSPGGDTLSTNLCVRQHFQEYTKLQNPQPTSGQANKVPLPSLPSPPEEGCPDGFQNCSVQSFSQLQHYLSNPSSFSLEIGCLTGAAQPPCCNSGPDSKVGFSSALPPKEVSSQKPPPSKTSVGIQVRRGKAKHSVVQRDDGSTKDINSSSKLWVQQSRRKSTQTLVTSSRKKWEPLKMQMQPLGDSERNGKAAKKQINIAFSFPKKPGLTATSNEPMLKLANLQFPHRRKRGAEVLSAEFVHKPQSEPLQKETSAPENPGLETKRSKVLNSPDLKKVPVADIIMNPVKKWKEPSFALPSEVSPQPHGADGQTREVCPPGVAYLSFDIKGNNYESHALNLLADLALGSCIPLLIPRDNGMMAMSHSPSNDSVKEEQGQGKPKSSRAASDHEYHRMSKLAKRVTSLGKASPTQNLPPADQKNSSDLPTKEKNPGISSRKNNVSTSPTKPPEVPPREVQEAAEVNKHSFISAEHSYASLMGETSKKSLYPRGAPYPGPAPSRNGTRNTRAGPLVGKVLPFRHQQDSAHHQRPFEAVTMRHRRGLLSPRLKEDFSKSHTISLCGESLKVTCQWEAEYLFHLDSRYTNDALEKTVIRALHGPWDPDLPDDVEEMKLILHMWVALFYSKPSKPLSSTRKVVEHSNPEKFVSINTTGDCLELSDDGEDWFGCETCPADSGSDPDQTPSSSLDCSTSHQGPFQPEESPADSQTDADGTRGVVDSTVSSSSGELPCEEEEEPSSTSCPESLFLAEHAAESLPVRARQPGVDPEEHLHDVSAITMEEPPKEELPDATNDPSATCKPQAALSRENPTPNSSTVPWRDSPTGTGEQEESRWAAGSGGGPGPPEDMESMGDAGNCTEVKDGSTSDSMPLEAHPKNEKAGDEEGKESPGPFGHSEKGEEELEKGEKEDSEHGSEVLGPCGSVFSEGDDANTEHDPREQKPGNWESPKDFGVPGEQKDKVWAPSAESWTPPGSEAAGAAVLESPCSQGLSPTFSPDSSSVCLTSLDGLTDPGAAPKDQEAVASIQSPSQSDLGRSLPQRSGGDVCADLTLLSCGDPNQGGDKVLVEEEGSSPSTNPRDVLEESSGGGQGFIFDFTALADDSEAGESDDLCLVLEESPRSDKMNVERVAVTPQENPETSLGHLLESEASSWVREELSATKEHPKNTPSSPNTPSPPFHGNSAPHSPPQQDLLPPGGDTDPLPKLSQQSKVGAALCHHGKSSQQGAAAELSLGGSLKPKCAKKLGKEPGWCHGEGAETPPSNVLAPGDLRLVPPSPPGPRTNSALGVHLKILSPGVNPAPEDSPGSCPSPGSPGGSQEKEFHLPEGLEGGSSVPLASPFPGEDLELAGGKQEGSEEFVGLHHSCMEVGEEGIPPLPTPTTPSDPPRGFSGEIPELGDTEDIPDVLPRAEQLPGKDSHVGLANSGDLLDPFSSDSEEEYLGGTLGALQTARSFSTMDAGGARTLCDTSCSSLEQLEGCSEHWSSPWAISSHIPPYINIRDSQGVLKDYHNFLITRKTQEKMEKQLEPSKSHRRGQSHLFRSLMRTWKGFEEITQHTLDVECLRFHYKLKETLRSGQPPFSTSKSIFPKDFPPQGVSPGREDPTPLSPGSRSPLQVTILPSDTRPSGLGWQGQSSCCGDPCTPWQDTTLCDKRSKTRPQNPSQAHPGPFHLSKLRYPRKLKDSGGDISLILEECAELHRVMLSRAEAELKGGRVVPTPRKVTGEEGTRVALPGKVAALEEMMVELCRTLRSRLQGVAKEAMGYSGIFFYLVETSEEPFFARVKTLLKKEGFVEMEPLSFCQAKRLDTERLLLVIRNEDISSHIHSVPCLLKLKHCPHVVFAGVDNPEDVTSHMYQELFHTGGFVVSDKEVLEMVTLGQLKEVVKVLEKLNRSGRWKWFLHYRESKKLREDIRVDPNSQQKHLILQSCQGADLLEVLHYHPCDSRSSPESEYIKCLLNLQVQHISSRFAVYLTAKPSTSREVLESKGILVADVSTFPGMVQKVAAPFRRSSW
ncbi:protein TASOR 2 isoform X3 [Heliangelus exortis]|uniref:protein TASOR 2 isoform X3 n=1 Tax=Heliangelus exortis TaxID=472823 RepID=UPI003A958C27